MTEGAGKSAVRDAVGGLRVLDLSRGFAGALVTQLLGDHGAEVIHVEPPGGDALRRRPAVALWHRNKKSVTLDLHDPAARGRACELAEGSDVLVLDFRPGVADAMGLGYEALAAANPGILHCSITGFGSRGPYARLKGYEGLVMARVGAMDQASGFAPRPGPAFPAVPWASFSAAQTALHGILAALWVRERTGLGQRIETSLVQGIAAHDPWDWFLHLVAERYPEAFRTAPPVSPRGVPNQSFAFRLLVCLTRDGHWLQFSQTSPHLFREFMEVLGLSWMYDDPEWSTAPDFETEEKREAFWERMLEAARAKTLAEWQRIFEAHPNVWAEAFRTPPELLDHPQMRHDGRALDSTDPRFGSTRTLAPMIAMKETPGRLRTPAPEAGEHTAEILARRKPAPPGPQRVEGRVAASREGSARPPLEGVTVLELGVFYAAPYGPALLADYGARVIKIEPLAGEPMRALLPIPDAGAIKSLQGKESVAVDVARPEGREILHRLVPRVDLVMVSYRAGVARRHGLDYETLRALNPRIVYLNAPGYGTDGPCGRRPAYAPTIGAAVGAGRLQAGPSIRAGADLSLTEVKAAALRLGHAAMAPGQADGCAALAVATALLLGLVARERTGLGQELSTSMLGSAAYCLSDAALGGSDPLGPDPSLFGTSALYRLYETADGWIFLAAPKESEWAALSGALAAYEALAADPRFATPADRREHDGPLAERLSAVFGRASAAEWEARLVAADVGCVKVARGPVARAVMDDPVGREGGILCDVEHPTFGPHRRLAPLATLTRTPGRGRPACLFGQHTAAVLRELGYGEEEVERLAREGVIARP